MFKKIFVITALILFVSSNCFALSVGNTSDPKTPYGPGISDLKASGMGPIKVGFDFDWIFEKDLDADSSTISSETTEGQTYLIKIGYNFADRFEPYVKLGFSHYKTDWSLGSTATDNYKVRGENALAYGIGGKVLVFDSQDKGIRVTLDGQLFYTNPDIEEADVGPLPNRSVTSTEYEISQWQIVGIISKEFLLNPDGSNPAAPYSIIPYVGGGYSDSKTNVQFTYAGTDYALDDAENDNKFILITGCDITSPEDMALNIEGRWVGETAASGGLTVKF